MFASTLRVGDDFAYAKKVIQVFFLGSFACQIVSQQYRVITSVLPVHANGQSMHTRRMITSTLLVRANGQSTHARTMITSMLPVRANGQSMHARRMMMSMHQCVRMARARIPAG